MYPPWFGFMRRGSSVAGLVLQGLLVVCLISAHQAHATECECGDTLTTDTTLTGDLLDCPEHGLTIDADGITLDGSGYRISGTGIGVGIKINGRDGVVVKNCEISNFEDGIKLRPGSERDSIGGNTIRDNTRYGIYSVGLWESTNRHSVISGNTIIDNDDSGIYFTFTNHDTIVDNIITGNVEKGVSINGQQQTSRDSYNHVLANEITGSNYGVYIGWAYGYQYVIDNTITDNNYGIAVWSTGFWTTFSGNTIHRNAVYGISAVGCFLLVMEGNDVQHNGQGFYVRGSMGEGSDSRLASNTIRNNANNGIYLDHQSGDWGLVDLVITANDISDNQGYGLYVGHAGVTSDSIYDNEFAANVLGNAYEVTGVTGNRWNSDSTGNLWDDWVLNPGYPEGIYYVDGPGDGIDSLPGSTARVPYSEEPAAAPSDFALCPTAPNPFGSGTTILYDLPHAAGVKIRVFDVSGRVVRVLADSPFQEPGRYEIHWDGCDANGGRVASGVYFCRMESGGFASIQKMTLTR